MAGWRMQLLEDLATTEEWVRRHLSDHSALHHRQGIIRELARRQRTETTPEVARSSAAELVDALCNEFRFATHIAQLYALRANVVEATPFYMLTVEYDLAVLCRYTGHEAIWCHRRAVFSQLTQLWGQLGRDRASVGGPAVWLSSVVTDALRDGPGAFTPIVSRELEFVEGCVLDAHQRVLQLHLTLSQEAFAG